MNNSWDDPLAFWGIAFEPVGSPTTPPLALLSIARPVSSVTEGAPLISQVSQAPTAGQAVALGSSGRVPLSALDSKFRTLTLNSVTPSVKDGNLFRVANTAATVITNLTEGGDGQRVTLIFTDAVTSLSASTTLRIGSNFASSADDTMELVYSETDSAWFRVGQQTN